MIGFRVSEGKRTGYGGRTVKIETFPIGSRQCVDVPRPPRNRTLLPRPAPTNAFGRERGGLPQFRTWVNALWDVTRDGQHSEEWLDSRLMTDGIWQVICDGETISVSPKAPPTRWRSLG